MNTFTDIKMEGCSPWEELNDDLLILQQVTRPTPTIKRKKDSDKIKKPPIA